MIELPPSHAAGQLQLSAVPGI